MSWWCCDAAFGEHESSCFNYKGRKMSEENVDQNCEQGKSGSSCCKNNNFLPACDTKEKECSTEDKDCCDETSEKE